MHDFSPRPRHHARRIANLEERNPALFTVSEPLPTIPLLSPLLTPILDPILEPLLTPIVAGLFPSTTTTATPTATGTTSSTLGASTSTSKTSGAESPTSNPTNTTFPGVSATKTGASPGTATSVSASHSSQSSAVHSSQSSGGVSDSPQDATASDGAASRGAVGRFSTSFQVAAAVGEATATDSNGQPLFTFSDPLGSTSSTTISAIRPGSTRSIGSGAGSDTGTASHGGAGASGTGSSASSSHHHGGLSAGAIAGIVIAAILLLASLFVFCVRQRRMRKRVEQRKNWWRGGPVVPEESMRSVDYSSDSQPRLSIRSSTSSFETPSPYRQTFSIPQPSSHSPSLVFDMDAFRRSPDNAHSSTSNHGHSEAGHSMSSSEFNTAMFQVPGANASLRPPTLQVTPALRTTTVYEASTIHRSDSPATSSSEHSGSTPYETAPEASRPDLLIPISPLSPAYSPTVSSFSGRRDSLLSATDSERDIHWADERRRLSSASQVSVRPFTPSESFAFPKPPGVVVRGAPRVTSADRQLLDTISEASRASMSAESFVTARSAETAVAPSSSGHSPFTDDAAEVPHAFGERDGEGALRTICRAFGPMREDELLVSRGERVVVLKLFGDGWALVQKSGEGGAVTVQGLIPQACFDTS